METSTLMNNSTTQIFEEFNIQYSVVTSGLCMVIFLLNSFIFSIIAYNKDMREFHEIIIASLSLSDALIGITSAQLPLLDYLTLHNATYGVFLSCLRVLAVNASSVHIITISIDRLIAVRWALKYHIILNPTRFKILLLMTWLIGIVITVFYFVTDFLNMTFSQYQVLQYMFIIMINGVIYSYLWRVAHKQRRRIEATSGDQNISGKINKATITAFLVVVCYGVLWAPYLISIAVREYTNATYVDSASFRLYNRYSFFVGIFNGIVNCTVYALLNKKFRSKLYKIKCCNNNE